MEPPGFDRIVERLSEAANLLRQGRAQQASTVLRMLIVEAPALADAHRLLGLAQRDQGDLLAAERCLRTALALDPASGPAAVALSEILLAQGRGEEALSVVRPLAEAAGADLHVLTAQGNALKALGRLDDSLIAYRRGVATAPTSAIAEHNVASVLGDLERFPESETATSRAFAKGLDAPETWLVRARALLGMGRNPEAEAAYREVLGRRPDDVEAAGELAQLVWMQTDDLSAASFDLQARIDAHPQVDALRLRLAELMQAAGHLDRAFDALAPILGRTDVDPMMLVIGARFSLWRNPARALDHALRAVALIPNHAFARTTLCEAYLANGEVSAGSQIAAELHREDPLDQHAMGLLTTAWRLAGDPRYGEYCDYQKLVGTSLIDTPSGWSTLDAYLVDLAESLERLHTLRTHPVGQSVRHGSQTSQRLTLSPDPVVRAFFEAVNGPIRRHVDSLRRNSHGLIAPLPDDFRFNGEWSVKLRAQGYHTGHLHPRGWLSSACYISLPAAIEHDREGWLKFGEPGVPTLPRLPAEFFVKPQPGQLVLFPSYMWHGTVPFQSDEARLTIAFDLARA